MNRSLGLLLSVGCLITTAHLACSSDGDPPADPSSSSGSLVSSSSGGPSSSSGPTSASSSSAGGGTVVDPNDTHDCAAPAGTASMGSCIPFGGSGGMAPAYPCNPVSQDGCDSSAGEACDVNLQSSSFQCYDPPNDNMLCTACNQVDGWCEPGLTCVLGFCAKYCCDDGDCSAGGECNKGMYATIGDGEVGVCLQPGSGGSGGAGGAAGGSGGAGGAAGGSGGN